MEIKGKYGTAVVYASVVDDTTKLQIKNLMDQKLTKDLNDCGVKVTDVPFLNNALNVEQTGSIETLKPYIEGKDVVIAGVGAARVLETTKVELEDYALIANVPNIKVNSAANADTIGGKQIVVSNEAPDPNGEDNQNIITIVI